MMAKIAMWRVNCCTTFVPRRRVVVIVSFGATLTSNSSGADVAPSASFAVAVTWYVPRSFGLPASSPVSGSNVSPGGLPVTVHLTGSTPPAFSIVRL